jgi:hypothetical protein
VEKYEAISTQACRATIVTRCARWRCVFVLITQDPEYLEAHRIGCEARLTGKLRNQLSSPLSANTPTAERMSARLKSRR